MNNKGTSLIELVIAVALIGIIVGPFLLFFNQTMTMNEGTNEIFDASQIATNCIEIIKKEAKECAVTEAGMGTIKRALSEVMGVAEDEIVIETTDFNHFSIIFEKDDYAITIKIIKDTIDGNNESTNYHAVIALVLDEENKIRGNIENWIRFDGGVSGG